METINLKEIFTSQSRPTLTSKLKWILLIRLLVATVFFGMAVGIQLRSGEFSNLAQLLYALIIGMYAFSAICGAILLKVQKLTLFALFQFFVDTLFITALIYVTGGAESLFNFLYFLNIISAVYVLFAPGAFITAALSGGAYGTLLLVTHTGILPHVREPNMPSIETGLLFYNVTVNVFAYLLVAFLASFLANQLRIADQALEEQRGHLRDMRALKNRIVESIESGVLTIDRDGYITSFNGAAQHITKLDAKTAEGAPLGTLLPGVAKPLGLLEEDDESRVETSLITSGINSWECKFTTQFKMDLILGCKVSPLRKDGGEIIGQIIIIDDLTHIRAMEQKMRRAEKMATIGGLAAGIAHEIRNPLASISGSIQVMRHTMQPEGDDAQLMDIVVRETDRLNGLITHFMEYVSNPPLQRSTVYPEALLKETIKAIEQHPKVQGKATIHLEAKTEARISGDPNQLRQVFWNLILNAVDAVGSGGNIWVQVRQLANIGAFHGPRLELQIDDDGPGIPDEIRPRIFDPFFSNKTGGTGLGLAIVEKIIQQHDGTINVEGRPEGGTRFIITLPAEKQSVANGAQSAHPPIEAIFA